MVKTMFDTIIIGGGASGAHFAYQSAKSGYSTLLVESKPPGRYKCCAGGISNRFLETYDIPSKVIERKITGFLMVSPVREKVEIDFERVVGVTVYRTQFDKWLLERAENAGAELASGVEAKNIHFLRDAVEVKLSDDQVYRSKLLVGAFGMSPTMFHQLQTKMPESVVGLQMELSMSEEDIDKLIGSKLEFYFDPSYTNLGYIWIFPKREGVSVGLVTSLERERKRDALINFIRNHPEASKKLEKSKLRIFDGRGFHSALIPNGPLEKTYGNRYLLLGDAAGFIDPTTWEGIYYSFRSADIAIEVLNEIYNESDFSSKAIGSYQARWKAAFGKEIRYATKIRDIVYGENMKNLWSFLISELNTNESLRRTVKEQLSKEMSVTMMVKRIPILTKLLLLLKYRSVAYWL